MTISLGLVFIILDALDFKVLRALALAPFRAYLIRKGEILGILAMASARGLILRVDFS
jgi:hypothetical protein